MAVNRSTQVAMTTALGIFVMLSFALGIMTYIFASRQFEAETERDAARQESVEAQNRLTAAEQQAAELRGIIGVDADTPVADIDTRLTEQFADFPQKEKSYSALVDLLNEARRSVEREQLEAVETTQADLAREREDKTAAIAAKKVAEDSRQEAASQLAKARQDFEAQWKQHEQNQTDLLTRQREAEEESRTLRNVQQEIARSREYIPPARRQGFEEKNPVEQLEVIREELRLQADAIVNLNAVLAQVRVSDPELQKKIAEYRSEDDRIEGFDGRIIAVDPREDSVLISCSTTTGIRPGLVLYVFPPGDPRPGFNARKATVEVSTVEGPSLLRATIREENDRDPILSGDGVATSLWAAGVTPRIVVVGFSDLDRDGRSDREQLVALVANAGGQVVDAVAPDTAFVVDLGVPPGRESDQPPEWAAEAKRYELANKTARIMGVPIVGLQHLLDALGLDEDAFKPGRLPRSLQTTRVPAPR